MSFIYYKRKEAEAFLADLTGTTSHGFTRPAVPLEERPLLVDAVDRFIFFAEGCIAWHTDQYVTETLYWVREICWLYRNLWISHPSATDELRALEQVLQAIPLYQELEANEDDPTHASVVFGIDVSTLRQRVRAELGKHHDSSKAASLLMRLEPQLQHQVEKCKAFGSLHSLPYSKHLALPPEPNPRWPLEWSTKPAPAAPLP